MPNEQKPYLSVVIPAYNEEKRLPNTLLAADKYLSTQPYSYEIVVVDDGSKDTTVQTAKNMQKVVKNLYIIENAQNHGKGYVVKKGMLESRGDVRLFMDADNATSVDHFAKMKPYFDKGAKVVIGSRDDWDAKGSVQAVKQPFHKRMLGNMGNLLIQIMVVPGIWDTQCGFKATTERAGKEIFSRGLIDRWGFDIEMLGIARALGYKIEKIPVYWVNDPNSKVSLKAYIQVLLETFTIRWNLWTGKYNIKK
jgi:dolichyl-phosphate beta-glucosyltransferase